MMLRIIRDAAHIMILIMQQLHIVWTKASRGGPGAVQRNGVPEVAKVPLQRVEARHPMLHQIVYRECDGFLPDERLVQDPTVRPLQVGCVTIDDAGETRRMGEGEIVHLPAVSWPPHLRVPMSPPRPYSKSRILSILDLDGTDLLLRGQAWQIFMTLSSS
jgi:hypothetical protein